MKNTTKDKLLTRKSIYTYSTLARIPYSEGDTTAATLAAKGKLQAETAADVAKLSKKYQVRHICSSITRTDVPCDAEYVLIAVDNYILIPKKFGGKK